MVLASFEVCVLFQDLHGLQHPFSLFIFVALNQTLLCMQLSCFNIMFPKQPFCATLKSLPLIEANNRTPYAQLEKINEKTMLTLMQNMAVFNTYQ